MPQWILACPECGKDFLYSEIKSELFGLPVMGGGWLDKPAFPEEGLPIECPNCHQKSIYKRFMLRFHEDHLV